MDTLLKAFPEIRLFLPKSTPDQNPGFVEYLTTDMRTGTLGIWFSQYIGRTIELEESAQWIEIESQDQNTLVNFKTNRHPSATKFIPTFRAVSAKIENVKFVEGKVPVLTTIDKKYFFSRL